MEQLSTQPKNTNRGAQLFANPLVRKLSKIQETSTEKASYAGIAHKCFFFMAMILCGIALALLLHNLPPFVLTEATDGMSMTLSEVIAGGISLVLFILTPIIAFLIRPAIPVAGALYCISTGVVLTLLGNLVPEYRELIFLALVLTIAVVVAMQILYSSGKIKVTQKFRTIVITLFLASILGSLLLFVCMFIPGLSGAAMMIANNQILGIVFSIIGIIIASLFLLVDFNTIQESISRGLPKKYEWMGAFTLTFSVIWLYFKILELLIRLKDSK
ncbi:MAG: Bax inhibitor-1/YccA family protein [Anaerovoracaceae bacterium]